MKLWPRVKLQVGWGDLAAGGLACVAPGNRGELVKRAESYWTGETALACFSVRSGFDLLLQSLDLQPDDEIIFSALNVKGMINIARRAGFVPVPLDFDVETVTPSVETLKKALSPKSKVLVVAHLFGCRLALDELIDVAREAGVLVVEDCAQAFNGTAYSGHPKADVCMFSFGPLKTATGLGGALINVRDSALHAKMSLLQDAYSLQPTAKQARRVLQFAGLKLLTSPLIFGLVQRGYSLIGKDYEDGIADRVRDVAVLKKTKNLRFRPSGALVRLMCRRLETFDGSVLKKRADKGQQLKKLLGDAVALPGDGNPHHDYWVFPILAEEPLAFIAKMRSHGFDAASLPRSQAVAAPADRPELEPVIAAQALSKLVILPCYDGLPDHELERLAHTARKAAVKFSGDRASPPVNADEPRPWWHADRRRKWRRRFVKRTGTKFIRKLASFLASQSLVSNAPVLEPEQFAFLKEFSGNWSDIRGEITKILEHKESVPAFEDVSADQKRIAKNRQWRTFILFGFGNKLHKNCAHAPITTRLLEQVPDLQTAWFSILEPGYRIPAHRGVTKGILRCHVGLIVPDDRQNCWMRVDQEKCVWEEGELLVFDDTYEHEVANDTPQERVVLLFDFERPMRFWGRVVNRLFIRTIKLTAYYKEPREKLKSFEEQFEAATRGADKLLEDMNA